LTGDNERTDETIERQYGCDLNVLYECLHAHIGRRCPPVVKYGYGLLSLSGEEGYGGGVCVWVGLPFREAQLPALLEYVPAGHEAHTAEDTAPGTATRESVSMDLKPLLLARKAYNNFESFRRNRRWRWITHYYQKAN
jgi:hypothetical protein